MHDARLFSLMAQSTLLEKVKEAQTDDKKDLLMDSEGILSLDGKIYVPKVRRESSKRVSLL